MRMLGTIIAAACLLVAARFSSAQTPPDAPDDVSALIEPVIAKHGVPGMAVAVTTGEKISAIGAAGVRMAGNHTPVTTRDEWHIGSCTKSMTGTLIGMLVQEGKLRWSLTLPEAFPELAAMDDGWKSATLEHLVTNRSGAPTDLSAGGLWPKLWTHDGDAKAQRATLATELLARAPLAKPGEKFIYSNAGFALAGAIAEREMETTWETLIREKLFAPLGMTSAGFGAPGECADPEHMGDPAQPVGHTADGTAVLPGPPGTAGLGGQRSRNSDNPGAIGPAGTVRCSIEDWARYIRVHLNGAAMLRGEAIDAAPRLGLSSETFTKLHTPYEAADDAKYAMGWGVTTRPWAKGSKVGDTGRVLTHSGSNTMWYCVAWLAPEQNFAVLVMCNKGGDEAAKACDAAASLLISRHVKARQVK
ncbi:MAG: serine hydrolase domain-containing protein [Phycisphaerales bacterium]